MGLFGSKPTHHSALQDSGFTLVGQRTEPGGRSGDITHYRYNAQSQYKGQNLNHDVHVVEYGSNPGKYDVTYLVRGSDTREPFMDGDYDWLARHKSNFPGGAEDPIALIAQHHRGTLGSLKRDSRTPGQLVPVTPANLQGLVNRSPLEQSLSSAKTAAVVGLCPEPYCRKPLHDGDYDSYAGVYQCNDCHAETPPSQIIPMNRNWDYGDERDDAWTHEEDAARQTPGLYSEAGKVLSATSDIFVQAAMIGPWDDSEFEPADLAALHEGEYPFRYGTDPQASPDHYLDWYWSTNGGRAGNSVPYDYHQQLELKHGFENIGSYRTPQYHKSANYYDPGTSTDEHRFRMGHLLEPVVPRQGEAEDYDDYQERRKAQKNDPQWRHTVTITRPGQQPVRYSGVHDNLNDALRVYYQTNNWGVEHPRSQELMSHYSRI